MPWGALPGAWENGCVEGELGSACGGRHARLGGPWPGILINSPLLCSVVDTIVLKYLKAAFTNRWNLLALMAATGAAIIGGRPDIGLPLVLAAEAAYLAVVGGSSKFQNYVDVEDHQRTRSVRSEQNEKVLQRIIRSLPRPLRERYYQLQQRCEELQSIAADLQQPTGRELSPSLTSLQVQGLDRLLWIYLRLLFTYNSLQKFLEKTSIDRIQRDIQRIESRLKLFDAQDDSPHAKKMRRTLEDNLKTSRDRASNYERARANHEFVELEIDRLENKIKSLAEVAVNRQEPDYVSSQVDEVANSMLETERTMNDLQGFTGLGPLEDNVPRVMEITTQRSGR